MILAENGISLPGDKFLPDTAVTQADFLLLLSMTLNYIGPLTQKQSDKDIDSMYNNLIRDGIIKESEKSPKAAVSNENGVKFIIRALKYDKVADLKGIYKDPFKDSKNITPGLYGYIVIAKGLGIIKADGKGDFNPKRSMTRADAAVMIYNYVKR